MHIAQLPGGRNWVFLSHKAQVQVMGDKVKEIKYMTQAWLESSSELVLLVVVYKVYQFCVAPPYLNDFCNHVIIISVRSSALEVIQGYECTSCPWHNVWQAAAFVFVIVLVFFNLLPLYFYPFFYFFLTFLQGWKWHSPACFWVGEESVTFNSARKVCASYNATLASISNR